MLKKADGLLPILAKQFRILFHIYLCNQVKTKYATLELFSLPGFAIFVTKVSVFITCVIVVTGALRLLHALLSVVPHLSGTSATWQAFSGAF